MNDQLKSLWAAAKRAAITLAVGSPAWPLPHRCSTIAVNLAGLATIAFVLSVSHSQALRIFLLEHSTALTAAMLTLATGGAMSIAGVLAHLAAWAYQLKRGATK